MTTDRWDGRWEGWSRWVSWRVTRYDPARRDWRGAYPYDEWTCGDDIGGTFRDGVLTPGRYLACEDAYVAVVEEAVRESGVAGLRVASLTPLPPPPACLPPLDPADEPEEGAWVPAGRVGAAVRAVLRGEGWARLEGKGLDVHCCENLYLWLTSRRDLPGALSLARGAGLFPEEVVSPFLRWERLPDFDFPGPAELALIRELVAERAPYLLGFLSDGASLFRLRGQGLYDLSHCVCEGVRDRLEAAPSGAWRLRSAGRLVGCPLERLFWTIAIYEDAEAAFLPDPPRLPAAARLPAGLVGLVAAGAARPRNRVGGAGRRGRQARLVVVLRRRGGHLPRRRADARALPGLRGGPGPRGGGVRRRGRGGRPDRPERQRRPPALSR